MTHSKSHESDEGDIVSIVGYSLRAPGCSSVPEFARALQEGRDLTTSQTRYPHGFLGLPPRQGRLKDEDLERFEPSFFGLGLKQAEAMCPSIRLLLKVSYEALMDAQINIQSLRGSSKTGVYVGHIFSDYVTLTTGPSPPNGQKKSGYELVNGAQSMAANRLSYFYDLSGPSMVIDTACSSSLVALDRAFRDIRSGLIDRAIVAGISLTLDPHKNECFNAFHMLSPTGHCHSFDTRADGYCRSDGIACIILERGARGYATVAGTATNTNGYTPEGITYPSSAQQFQVLQQAFAESKSIGPSSVTFHEAHGTGTTAGDKEELAALDKFYNHKMYIGSVKSNMGHAEAASGLMGVAKVLLMMETNMIFPNFDFRHSPHLPIQNGKFVIPQKTQPWQPAPCTVSSFGFGGANACAVLVPCKQKKFVRSPTSPASSPFAATPGSTFLECHRNFFTLQRAIGNHCNFPFEFKENQWVDASPLVFVLDGQGSQWIGMGQDLMETSESFRNTIRQLDKATGIPLLELYANGTKWMQKEYGCIGIVSFQLGLINLLAEKGIHPDYFLGHSLGEIACAYLGGIQTGAEVMKVAQVRATVAACIRKDFRLDVYNDPPLDGFDYTMSSSSGKTQWLKETLIKDSVPADAVESLRLGGKMAVVGCRPAPVEEALAELGFRQTCIACYNSPSGLTLSGPAAEVDQVLALLRSKDHGMFIRELDTDEVAYHAPYLNAFRETLKSRFGETEEAPLPLSWLSTSRNDVFSVDYLLDNICGPVYFHQAIEKLPASSTVVEIGPSSGLLAQIKRTRSDLQRVGLVQQGELVDINSILDKLHPWIGRSKTEKGTREAKADSDERETLCFDERYPNIWGQQSRFSIPKWDAFDLNSKGSDGRKVVFDLSRDPFKSLRGHVVRGQTILPAAGFMYALWSANNYEKRTEILDFRVITPLVISETQQEVELLVRQVGEVCEAWDVDCQTCYASGRVRAMASNLHPPDAIKPTGKGVSSSLFYSHIRRMGYAYDLSYIMLDKISTQQCTYTTRPLDWVSYLDGFFQYHLFQVQAFGYPRGANRVCLWENDLGNADLNLRCLSSNCYATQSVSFEDVRIDYLPVPGKTLSTYREEFVEYSETDTPLADELLVNLLMRETNEFRVQGTVKHPALASIVSKLRSQRLPLEVQSTRALVISDFATIDANTVDANLLLTVDQETPGSSSCLVARWGAIRLVRCTTPPRASVAYNWTEVPAKNPVVWTGTGSSGAVACLRWERDQFAMAYEGTDGSNTCPGLSKQMRQNYIVGGHKHGVFVETKMEADEARGPQVFDARLKAVKPGLLESLEWIPIDQRAYQVEVRVAALNFRDVMRAMGQLKEKDISLGLEFSGVDKSTEKRVFGVATEAMSTHCNPVYCFPTPSGLSDEEAATIPIVYLTAYFSMLGKAKMKPGQSILVHCATGGVGMAAVNIALKRGYRVIATCSAAKRAYLKERTGLKDEMIGDSRSDRFVQTVMQATGGRGVDVVLNQLSGGLQVQSLRCLKAAGHFVELGKYDVLQNTAIGQGLLERNISFHVVDLLPLLCDPSYAHLWNTWLEEGFQQGEISPLPVTAFKPNEAVDAFRFMSQGKHKGKIVITGLGSIPLRVTRRRISVYGQVHLITGGLGGLGLSLAVRLAEEGCREIVLVGRSGVTNEFQRHQIQAIERMGCKVTLLQTSVLDLSRNSAAPDRIWHCATVYRDMRMDQMSHNAWDDVLHVKVDGYKRLRECWLDVPVVAISSISGYFGNAMQTNYGFANASLDAFARVDPNTISCRLGPLDNVGFITKAASHRAVLERMDCECMRIDDVLDSLLEIATSQRSGVFSIYEMKPKAEQCITFGTGALEYTHKDAQVAVARILGGKPQQYKKQASLKKAGLDSLSSMEVVNLIHSQSGDQTFKVSQITDDFSIETLTDAINSSRKLRVQHSSKELGVIDAAQKEASKRINALDTTTSTPASSFHTMEKTATQSTFGPYDSSSSNPPTIDEEAVQDQVGAQPVLNQVLLESLQSEWTVGRKTASLAFAAATVWWLSTLVVLDNDAAGHVLYNALVVFCVSHLIRISVEYCSLRGVSVRGAFECSHYLQESIVCCTFVILYACGSDVFLENWSPIYFGSYIFHMVGILAMWNNLHPSFRVFYSMHHSFSFAMTGSWRIPAANEENDWEEALVLAVMLYLTAELWQYGLFVFRHLRGNGPFTQRQMVHLKLLAFCMERIQRAVAFSCYAFLEEKHGLATTVLITGVSSELLDVYFQGKAIVGLYRAGSWLAREQEEEDAGVEEGLPF
ncbi:Mycocerosic acid synthase-like polyketide synthase [Seminavis robusta]|uniref:Fatty acid synthase n=1 Tax=Seminavis robusta TaxID=568900 RepID=A0A9N8DE00_9STRA|nr:Mycocerosic acid synthase-like polyketide synthase [Seminavis robusta]|eukprot:Sro28_g018870.1 Mycocerosic acid synthase-like polyketide synthase (2290) ;mRNA; r:143992-151159